MQISSVVLKFGVAREQRAAPETAVPRAIAALLPALLQGAVVTVVSACGAMAADRDSEQVSKGSEALFCPAPNVLDAPPVMCANTTSDKALGPFSPEMVERCKRIVQEEPSEAGAEVDCEGSEWPLALARRIRGTRPCPPGTELTDKGYCVAEINGARFAYGPFTEAQVEHCKRGTQ